MFGHKTIYKVTNLKVDSKGRYCVLNKLFFKNFKEWLVWTTKLFSCICDITKINPALLKLRPGLIAFTYLGAIFCKITTYYYSFQKKHIFLKNIMLRLQNNINMLGDLKTAAFEC